MPIPSWPMLMSGQGTGGSGPTGSAILMESSGYILMETGDHILTES